MVVASLAVAIGALAGVAGRAAMDIREEHHKAHCDVGVPRRKAMVYRGVPTARPIAHRLLPLPAGSG